MKTAISLGYKVKHLKFRMSSYTYKFYRACKLSKHESNDQVGLTPHCWVKKSEQTDSVLAALRRWGEVASLFSRDISGTSQRVENMADEHGQKWDRCLADTAVKTG